ncbi:hypothetical protein AA0113_g3650 [Alternaria arborescens]|uniref:Uncharacterized protein n=2 Tax=Alternaria sect. Alternaria TaxID=2499237 RepID=A0A4Q4SGT1_9PLEO|nr:hypothetical protein AA0111_g9480 [Alternaria arborescens]KAB2101115.1 hypothetical protein AG0111_0g10881 [Alternaria gaisen]RII10330.1 hypothetical protein CUC08_Gglean006320 [Alternaria sp. MG1]RYN40768.1 hypothetical protein AA0112_g2679 [Alternaria arborescens]RYO21947.1 hypothetical protein AA0111_g9480 [Alternaria arborescens]RYO69774.1 hypothetical protein AA0113_g3650 [Alternaria arborescens]
MATDNEEPRRQKVKKRPRKRRATVYDAVHRKVARTGLIAHIRDPKASRKPLRPDEVLFKRKNAPMRYEEDDYYPAHSKLPANQKLPSGDLADVLRTYVSTLWARTKGPRMMQRTWRGMDESALIALSILMEETARGALGETGDLAFTEAAEEDEEQVLARQKQWTQGTGGKKEGAIVRAKKKAQASKEKQRAKERARLETWTSSDEESHGDLAEEELE